MIFFFLSSGLFLGWSLGANDAANVFGAAVGTRMVSFTKAAIIASIFVILGAVIQGAGATDTLGKLGTISAIGGSFTVALSAALTVYWMTKFRIPVSTSQAIVGAIIGWNFYTGLPTDIGVLSKIVSTWIMGPILGAIIAIFLYYFQHLLLKVVKVHLLKQDAYIRFSLLAIGAFGSFSLGANNIANVMGVFVSAAPESYLDFGLFKLSGVQQLFLLGGIAISVGIFTYSKRVMDTVGNGLMQLSSKSAIITVLSHSIVLFIFSSTTLSNFVVSIGFPPIPLVPVSSSQVIVGSILGLGLLKGGYNINFKILGGIATGWVATPFIAGILSFFALFFISNVFLIPVSSDVINSPIEQKVIVIDSTNEVHLKDIFASGLKFNGSVLFSGSAGLANHFPNIDNKNEKIKVKIENNKCPVIVIAGSRNTVMEEQIKYLKNRVNFTELKINLEEIFSNKERILDDYTSKCIKSIKGKRDLVIRTNAISNERKLVNKKLMLEYNISFRELEIKIKTFLGELTSRIVKNCYARNLILTGGDVALGVCKELGISNLTILDELLPGIPLSLAVCSNIFDF